MTSKAILTLAVLLSSCSVEAPTSDDQLTTVTETALVSGDLRLDVALRGTGRAVVSARVYTNPRDRGRTTVLAVPGFSETGFTFGPLSKAIFADTTLGRIVKRVVAIDLPGHADSGFPTGLPNGVRFGDLTIDDNVDVIVQAIDVLGSHGLAPHVMLAHSMGGLELQATQQALLSQGSSLAAHGVSGVVLLAPVPPHGQPWNPAPSGDPTPFIVNDTVLGGYLSLPPEIFIGQAFATPRGELVAGTPTPEQVVARRYVGFEPLVTFLQLVESRVSLPTGGTVVLSRPLVNSGIFASRNGTTLAIVSFEQDVLVPAADLGGLHAYLTNHAHDPLYHRISTPDAVHSMLISNPVGLINAIRPMFQRMSIGDLP